MEYVSQHTVQQQVSTLVQVFRKKRLINQGLICEQGRCTQEQSAAMQPSAALEQRQYSRFSIKYTDGFLQQHFDAKADKNTPLAARRYAELREPPQIYQLGIEQETFNNLESMVVQLVQDTKSKKLKASCSVYSIPKDGKEAQLLGFGYGKGLAANHAFTFGHIQCEAKSDTQSEELQVSVAVHAHLHPLHVIPLPQDILCLRNHIPEDLFHELEQTLRDTQLSQCAVTGLLEPAYAQQVWKQHVAQPIWKVSIKKSKITVKLLNVLLVCQEVQNVFQYLNLVDEADAQEAVQLLYGVNQWQEEDVVGHITQAVQVWQVVKQRQADVVVDIGNVVDRLLDLDCEI